MADSYSSDPPAGYERSDHVNSARWQSPSLGQRISYGETSRSQGYYQSALSGASKTMAHTYGCDERYGTKTIMRHGINSPSQEKGDDVKYEDIDDQNDLDYEDDQDDQDDEVGQHTMQYGQLPDEDGEYESDSESGEGGERNKPYQGLIRNEDHYQETKARRLRAKPGRASNDGRLSEFPESEEEQRELVKELFESILDTTNVLDKSSKNGKPAQAVRRFSSGFYSDKFIEMKCWEIVLGCRDASMGVKLSGNTAKGRKEVYTGFRDRFDKILEGCKVSKALCKQIMDPTYINRLIAAPSAEIRMKHNNKKINAERDIQNEIGRKAVKRGIKLNDLDQLVSTGATSSAISHLNQPLTGTPNTTNNGSPPNKTMTPKNPAHGLSLSTLPSTIKRRAWTSVRYIKDEYTEDGDNSDEDYESPKRQRRSTKASKYASRRQSARKAPSSNKLDLRSMARTSLDSIATNEPAISPGHAVHQMPAMSSGMGSMEVSSLDQHSRMLSTMPSGIGGIAIPPPLDPAVSNRLATMSMMASLAASPAESQRFIVGADTLEVEYKLALCKLLEVDNSWSELYTLYQLRTYARAYNSEFAYDDWYYPPNFTGRGFTLSIEGGYYCDHFSQALPIFQGLAVARGDIAEGGIFIRDAPHIAGFARQTSPFIRQVLGIVPNPFGLHDNLHSIRQSQRDA